MLTKREEEFLIYWEKNRVRQRKWIWQLAVGLPLGLLIGVLILVNFYAGWYKRAEMIANSRMNPVVLMVAVALIAVFFAVFSRKFQWDQRELRYRELVHKKKQAEANAAEQQVPRSEQ